MKNLCKCHFAYLLNQTTMVIFIITHFLMMIIFIGNALIDYHPKYLIIDYYYTSSFVVRIVFAFKSVFLYANTMIAKNDFYAYFILTSKISREKYIITKIIVCALVLLFNIVCSCLLFLLIGFCLIKEFYFQWMYVEVFINIFFVILVFGIYSLLIIQLINNLFVIIIPYALIIMASNFSDLYNKSNLDLVFLFFFPYDSNLFGKLHIIWLIVVIAFINVIIYKVRDLNY